MSTDLNALQKRIQGAGASCLVLIFYLHPTKLIYDRYPNKDKHDALGGIIIIRRDIIRFTRREQLCIFKKQKYFRDHELHWVQKRIRVIREVSEAHTFKYSEDKDGVGGVRSNPMPVRLLFMQLLKRI